MTRGEVFLELAMPEGKLVGPRKASSKVTRPIFFLYMGGMLVVVETYLSKTLVASANALEKSQYRGRGRLRILHIPFHV